MDYPIHNAGGADASSAAAASAAAAAAAAAAARPAPVHVSTLITEFPHAAPPTERFFAAQALAQFLRRTFRRDRDPDAPARTHALLTQLADLTASQVAVAAAVAIAAADPASSGGYPVALEPPVELNAVIAQLLLALVLLALKADALGRPGPEALHAFVELLTSRLPPPQVLRALQYLPEELESKALNIGVRRRSTWRQAVVEAESVAALVCTLSEEALGAVPEAAIGSLAAWTAIGAVPWAAVAPLLAAVWELLSDPRPGVQQAAQGFVETCSERYTGGEAAVVILPSVVGLAQHSQATLPAEAPTLVAHLHLLLRSCSNYLALLGEPSLHEAWAEALAAAIACTAHPDLDLAKHGLEFWLRMADAPSAGAWVEFLRQAVESITLNAGYPEDFDRRVAEYRDTLQEFRSDVRQSIRTFSQAYASLPAWLLQATLEQVQTHVSEPPEAMAGSWRTIEALLHALSAILRQCSDPDSHERLAQLVPLLSRLLPHPGLQRTVAVLVGVMGKWLAQRGDQLLVDTAYALAINSLVLPEDDRLYPMRQQEDHSGTVALVKLSLHVDSEASFPRLLEAYCSLRQGEDARQHPPELLSGAAPRLSPAGGGVSPVSHTPPIPPGHMSAVSMRLLLQAAGQMACFAASAEDSYHRLVQILQLLWPRLHSAMQAEDSAMAECTLADLAAVAKAAGRQPVTAEIALRLFAEELCSAAERADCAAGAAAAAAAGGGGGGGGGVDGGGQLAEAVARGADGAPAGSAGDGLLLRCMHRLLLTCGPAAEQLSKLCMALVLMQHPLAQDIGPQLCRAYVSAGNMGRHFFSLLKCTTEACAGNAAALGQCAELFVPAARVGVADLGRPRAETVDTVAAYAICMCTGVQMVPEAVIAELGTLLTCLCELLEHASPSIEDRTAGPAVLQAVSDVAGMAASQAGQSAERAAYVFGLMGQPEGPMLGLRLTVALINGASGALPSWMLEDIVTALRGVLLAFGSEHFGCWLAQAISHPACLRSGVSQAAKEDFVQGVLETGLGSNWARLKNKVKIFCGGKKRGTLGHPARARLVSI